MRLDVYLVTYDISKRDFSKAVDCSYEHMTNIVKGRVCPSRRLLRDICVATKNQVTAHDIKEHYVNKKLKIVSCSADPCKTESDNDHEQNRHECKDQQHERLVS